MITIPIEDWVFAVCAIVGLVLLLIVVVFDDVVGGLLDGFGFDVGGTTITPILLGDGSTGVTNQLPRLKDPFLSPLQDKESVAPPPPAFGQSSLAPLPGSAIVGRR